MLMAIHHTQNPLREGGGKMVIISHVCNRDLKPLQRANKENSKIVRGALVFGTEATKFQKNLLPSLSRHLCLHAC
jgi:hypothetical protein